MRAVVLMGVDQDIIAASLARHAPQVVVHRVVDTDKVSAMHEVVQLCAQLAEPGDTVLLAPGCASWDMYRDYGQRGDIFAEMVRGLDS